MNLGIIGFGNQGAKRFKLLKKKDVKFIFDQNKHISHFNKIEDLPLDKVSAVFLCVPDNIKYKLIKFFLKKKKHILVEKPLLINNKEFYEINKLSKKKYLVYTAYNHRFEPNIINLKKKISKNIIGKIFSIKIFYGNGTSQLVKDSIWKDKGHGVLTDLGSHIIDLMMFLFPKNKFEFDAIEKNIHQNKSYDHILFKSSNTKIKAYLEATLLSWKNEFYIDVIGELGSLHVKGLCKWGPSYLIHRKRKYPSGIPKETIKKTISTDPTWRKEHMYFEKMINSFKSNNFLKKDLYITKELLRLTK
jgi:scyllo-inositol 2-dehydrogenase (NADP+)